MFGTGEELTSKNLRRKAYWLIKNPDYILVHYLEVIPKRKPTNPTDVIARASEILRRGMLHNVEETKEHNYNLAPSTWNMPIEPLSPIQ